MNEQARALMKQTETFKREAAALQEEVSRQKDQFEQKLEEAESSFELRQQEFTEKIEQLSLQTGFLVLTCDNRARLILVNFRA